MRLSCGRMLRRRASASRRQMQSAGSCRERCRMSLARSVARFRLSPFTWTGKPGRKTVPQTDDLHRRKDMAESVRNIAVLVGSLRKGSLNRKMANALRALAPEHLKLEIVEIGNLPLYNADLDENPPQEWVQFRNRIKAADAVLFVTPEYNRSVPAGLKTAIDVG